MKRKTGFLVPTFSTSSVYGFGVAVPYYFALAPDYDATFTPMITTQAGSAAARRVAPAAAQRRLQHPRDRHFPARQGAVLNDGYDAGLSRLARQPGDVGPVQSLGQMGLGLGWHAAVRQDLSAGLRPPEASQASNLLKFVTPDYALSQVYLAGRGDRSYFDARAMYFYGFSRPTIQRQLPVVHPVIDHDYVFKNPIFGGELSFASNLTSLSRETANFDPISQARRQRRPVRARHRRSGGQECHQLPAARRARRLHPLLHRVDRGGARSSTRSGQMFTPFVILRADVADMNISAQPGVSNYINVGQTDIGRVMPTAGLEYRYPLINVQSWGTQTIEPIAQLIFRPNETHVGAFPNEDAQSLIFDDSNLFKVNKFSGWDRVEGGGRANVGMQYTAQFNRGGNVNFLFGQSYQLYGQNSFALGGTTNTGLDSGLDTSALRLCGARVVPAELAP